MGLINFILNLFICEKVKYEKFDSDSDNDNDNDDDLIDGISKSSF